MPKQHKKRCAHKLQHNVPIDVIDEQDDRELQVKIEPVDTGSEYESMELPRKSTVIYTENDENVAAIEAEIGLESQMEFIKTEFVVDEEILNEFREEIMELSRESELREHTQSVECTNPPKRIEKTPIRKRKRDVLEMEEKEEDTELEENEIDTGINESEATQLELQPLEIVVDNVRMAKCRFCNFQLTSRNRSIVKKHMRVHTGVKPYACRHCSKKFISRSLLMYHIRYGHPTKRRYKCTLCGFWLFTKNDFQAHELKCVKRRSFECHLCKFNMKGLYMRHIKDHMGTEHTGEKVFQCCHCEETFATKAKLRWHERHHPGVVPFECSNCKSRYATEEKLSNHKSICLNRDSFECHLCKYTNPKLNTDGLKEHMRKHTGEKPFQCEYCLQFYSRSQALKYHLQRHRDLFKFECVKCLRRFLNTNELEQHVNNCRRIRYECYLCGFSNFGVSFSSFRKHMNVHTKLKCGGQIFTCNFCPRIFQIEHNLKSHIKSHTKIGLLKCDYCDKLFSDMKYKKKHEHQCKRIYECYLCKETFPSFAILKGVHVRTHLGVKPYNCTHCTKSFASIRTYTLHVLNAHVHQYKFKCNICNKIIKKRQDVAKHQRSCMKPIRQSVDIVYFKCSLCGLGLPRVRELRNHILNTECAKHPKKVRANQE